MRWEDGVSHLLLDFRPQLENSLYLALNRLTVRNTSKSSEKAEGK